MNRLVVLNLDAIDPEWAHDIETLPGIYVGELDGNALRHLAHLADERKARDEQRLLEVLYGAEVATF